MNVSVKIKMKNMQVRFKIGKLKDTDKSIYFTIHLLTLTMKFVIGG